MQIHVYLLCYNEDVLLPHTIAHYKKHMPSCKITIYDNESTDTSVEIAEAFGCNVISWSSNNSIDDFKYLEIKNNCWKNINTTNKKEPVWSIVADMDEWLCITEAELTKEFEKGTTILSVKGLEMIGRSQCLYLSDINLHEIKAHVEYSLESKSLCFLGTAIKEIDYGVGAHSCKPVGKIQYSSTIYYNKHMSMLGMPFLENKMVKRNERATEMQKKGLATHYTNDYAKIEKVYMDALARS